MKRRDLLLRELDGVPRFLVCLVSAKLQVRVRERLSAFLGSRRFGRGVCDEQHLARRRKGDAHV